MDVHLGGSILHFVTDNTVVIIALFVESDIDFEIIFF